MSSALQSTHLTATEQTQELQLSPVKHFLPSWSSVYLWSLKRLGAENTPVFLNSKAAAKVAANSEQVCWSRLLPGCGSNGCSELVNTSSVDKSPHLTSLAAAYCWVFINWLSKKRRVGARVSFLQQNRHLRADSGSAKPIIPLIRIFRSLVSLRSDPFFWERQKITSSDSWLSWSHVGASGPPDKFVYPPVSSQLQVWWSWVNEY